MKIDENVALSSHSTMGLGGVAAYLCEVSNIDELIESVNWAKERSLPTIMIGSGSNIVWKDEGYNGLVIVNNILGYQKTEDETGIKIKVGAGEIWDSVVERTVEDGLTGIEGLSLIPGRAGATPVQNVGAYGQDLSETLINVEVFDTTTNEITTIDSADCGFNYRTSRFKTTDYGRFFILHLNLKLVRDNPKPPFYPSVQKYFADHKIQDPTPADLRTAVISIRQSKLPDPKEVKNNGSFFGNPIISNQEFDLLHEHYQDMPNWPAEEGVKISAAWLIDRVGFSDSHDSDTGMGTWPKQSLVIINESAKSTADLLAYKQKIVDAVSNKFGIKLMQEPELLPKD